MEVLIVPQLTDNYAYLIHDGASREAAVVDPADAGEVLRAAQAAGLALTAILNTHHHGDHTGGNEDLARAEPGLRVIGYRPDAGRIPGLTTPVGDGEAFTAAGLGGVALAVPCHTSGHVAYRFGDVLFTGDTLFSAGCGRFFEGTAAEMHRALHEVIGRFPDDTLIYCGHEYTQANLRFALAVEPDNPEIASKLEEVSALRAAGKPTVPSRLGDERRYNPFLRAAAPGIRRTVREMRPEVDVDDPIAVLGALRALKDTFRA